MQLSSKSHPCPGHDTERSHIHCYTQSMQYIFIGVCSHNVAYSSKDINVALGESLPELAVYVADPKNTNEVMSWLDLGLGFLCGLVFDSLIFGEFSVIFGRFP